MTRLACAPALVGLARGGVVGVVGQCRTALALVRSLVCQAGIHHGSADQRVRRRGPGWDWVKWRPLTHESGGAPGRSASAKGGRRATAS